MVHLFNPKEGLRYQSPEAMKEALKHEEKVYQWLMRSYKELEDLFKLLEEAKEENENNHLDAKKREALVKSLVNKSLRELRGVLGEERVERKLDREVVGMEKVLHELIENLRQMFHRSGLELDNSTYLDHPQHYLRNETADDPKRIHIDEKTKKVTHYVNGNINVSLFRILEILNKLEVFKADLEKLCSRAGQIENDIKTLKKEESEQYFKKALNDLSKAIKDVQAFSELVNELKEKTKEIQERFLGKKVGRKEIPGYKKTAEQEANNDNLAMKTAIKIAKGIDVPAVNTYWDLFEEQYQREYLKFKRLSFSTEEGRYKVLDAFMGEQFHTFSIDGFSIFSFWNRIMCNNLTFESKRKQILITYVNSRDKEQKADKLIKNNHRVGVRELARKLALLTFGINYFFSSPTALLYISKGGNKRLSKGRMVEVIKSVIGELPNRNSREDLLNFRMSKVKGPLKKLCRDAFGRYGVRLRDIKKRNWNMPKGDRWQSRSHKIMNRDGSLNPRNQKLRKELVQNVMALF